MPVEPKRRVLIVDDDPLNTVVLQKYLQAQFEPHAANCADQALAYLAQHVYAALLIDIRLGEGDKDGLQLLAQIKDRSLLKGAKTVAITAQLEDLQEDLLAQGFDIYCRKPISKTELLALLDQILADSATS
ncbi:MAG: response regulator [Bernardetiaceae bacterium]|jgi:CheY-like chemotaxis protein|nr:response regulator [Bernardetiaceae bacterium]